MLVNWDQQLSAIDDLVKTGKPALEASLEQWGLDTLKQMQKESQGQLNAAVKEITAKDPAPGSFGAALSATLKGTVLETNGLLIVSVIGGLIFLGIVLGGKK